MGTPLCVQRYRLYLVFVPRPSAGGCPPCCSPLTKPSLLFAATPPTPFSPNQEGVPSPLGVPGCLPSCFPLRGPNWCRYFSWGRRGSVHSACRPHPRCTGLGGGGCLSSLQEPPGARMGLQKLARASELSNPPFFPPLHCNNQHCTLWGIPLWGQLPSSPTSFSGWQAAVDAKLSVALVKQPAPQRAKATPYAGRQPV